MRRLRTLLLNQAYIPIRIVDWQLAITMLYLDKVDILAEYDVVIHSQHETWNVPAVLHLNHKIEYFVPYIKFKREYVYTRDGWRCQYCGKSFKPKDLTYDHVVPRSRGAPRSWENIVSSCVPCNQQKGNKTPDEAGMTLLRKPKRPNWFPALMADGLGHKESPEEWEPYLEWVKGKGHGI